MHLTLLESDRSLLGSPEYSLISILAHAGVVWLVVSMSVGGRQLPTDEREAKAFFLLPPNRVETQPRQAEVAEVGKIGGSFADGTRLTDAGDGVHPRAPGRAAKREGKRSSALGVLAFGPAPSL